MDLSKLSKQELESEREKVGEALWKAKFPHPDHQSLEKRFNEIDKELFLRQGGKPADYKHKYDIRHYFDFRVVPEPKTGSKAAQIAGMALQTDGTPYVLRPTDEVINWRNTEIGARYDKKTRKDKGRYGMDDAGHLIGLQFGTDPSDARNIADQNFLQNQGGGSWHSQEKDFRSGYPRTNAVASR